MTLKTLVGVAGIAVAAASYAQITFFEQPEFRGRNFSASGPIDNFANNGFNDKTSSIVIYRGRWEVCEHAHFEGRCVVLRSGSYPSLASIGLNNQISSVRPLYREQAYQNEVAPPMAQGQYYGNQPQQQYYGNQPQQYYNNQPQPYYQQQQYQQSNDTYQANVVAVRAVVGPPEQRCWVERQQLSEQYRNGPNIPGAVIGGVIGGVLGHQIGGGRGRDVATSGGAVAGAAIGANAGRGDPNYYSQDVERCRTVRSDMRPDYWDVTYIFNGEEHHVQMSAPPGPTIAVNGNGEPRG